MSSLLGPEGRVVGPGPSEYVPIVLARVPNIGLGSRFGELNVHRSVRCVRLAEPGASADISVSANAFNIGCVHVGVATPPSGPG